MAHARQQIREAVATILKTTPTNWRLVLETRQPTGRVMMPYLLVYWDNELDQVHNMNAPRQYLRDMQITVQARVAISEIQTTEDKLDAIAAEVETKLTESALRTALPKVTGLALAATDAEIVEDENNAPPYIAVTLTWRVTYVTAEGAPETLI